MRTESTRVLVVGGGLVGLSAALFLAWRGVPVVLIERHADGSEHPRAVGFAPRTAELYRAVGLESRIPRTPTGVTTRRVRADSLAGQWSEELVWTPPAAAEPEIEHSPCAGFGIAQDTLEPLVRDRARELGADVRMGTELVSFDQDGTGVRAVLSGDDGEYTVLADYLVAADGHRSPVRAALGIGHTGRGHLKTVCSVLFRAPLDEYLATGIGQFEITGPPLRGFLASYGDGRWLLIHDEDQETGSPRELVLRAVGRRDVAVTVLTTGRWDVAAVVADRFRVDRVLLAGDAAHTLPPNRGAYGVNTGIEDAHNLAWKIAAVLDGASAPELLDTYEPERRPIALTRHDQIFARADGQDPDGGSVSSVPIIDDVAMAFGQIYRSAALPGATADLPPARRPDQWAGQPGTRAPHLWLDEHGERLSTVDLFQRGWVLLAADTGWADAAARATAALGIPVACHVPGSAAVRTAYGIGDRGASLVRPDGYIAWRTTDGPTDALTAALGTAAVAARAPRPVTEVSSAG